MSFMFAEKKSVLFVLGACLLWAIDLLVRYPVTLKLGYVHIIFLESLLAFLFVTPWLFKNSKKVCSAFSKQTILLFVFLGGVGMTIAGYLSTVSIQQATPGTFSFFQMFQPIIVICLAHLFLREKFENMYIYWGLWVMLSAVLMYSQDLELMFTNESGINLPGVFIAFGTTII